MLLSLVVRTTHPPVRRLESTTPQPRPRIHLNSFVLLRLRTLVASTQKPLLSFHRLTHSSAKRFSPTLDVSITSTLFAKTPGVAFSPQFSSSPVASPECPTHGCSVPKSRRIRTYKTVWKQTTLTTFRITTSEKAGGSGVAFGLRITSHDSQTTSHQTALSSSRRFGLMNQNEAPR